MLKPVEVNEKSGVESVVSAPLVFGLKYLLLPLTLSNICQSLPEEASATPVSLSYPSRPPLA